MELIVSQKEIENRIFTVRGAQVMLDSDLAEMYAVPSKRLNEQVKRNIERFPDSFRFQLTSNEWENLRSQIATLKNDSTLKYQTGTSKSDESLRCQTGTLNGERSGRNYLPYVFTEQTHQ